MGHNRYKTEPTLRTVVPDRSKKYSVLDLPIPFYSQRVPDGSERVSGFANKAEAAYWQERGCGIACLRMVIDGYRFLDGLPAGPSQGELTRMGLQENAYCDRGWIHKGLVAMAAHLDITGWTYRSKSTAEIKAAVDSGYPTIASVSVGFHGGERDMEGLPTPPGGHLVVVLGYAGEGAAITDLLVNHPSSVIEYEWERRYIPIRAFEASFSGAFMAFTSNVGRM